MFSLLFQYLSFLGQFCRYFLRKKYIYLILNVNGKANSQFRLDVAIFN